MDNCLSPLDSRYHNKIKDVSKIFVIKILL